MPGNGPAKNARARPIGRPSCASPASICTSTGKEPRPGRKMGHFTVIGDTADSALERARQLKAAL